ncbi:hypothetical protein ACQP2T_60105 [Nonomuraea sp. CA-143628]|uniref:hypothetical protein n=1 Tax=Nonomuraea sp. CA-143628 TaxID=3239997 RepID=UPI003D9240CC
MANFESVHHSRVITGARTLADVLDNGTDALALSQLVATVLLVVIVALHAVADLLENCPDSLALYGSLTSRLGRK